MGKIILNINLIQLLNSHIIYRLLMNFYFILGVNIGVNIDHNLFYE
jgi:hypothetical protein